MKVIYVVPDLVIGGVTSVVVNNIRELQKKDCEVLLVSLKDFNTKNDFSDINKKSLHINDFKSYVLKIKAFNRVIKDFKPDIIHSHTLYPHMFVRLHSLIYFNNIIKICNEHGTYNYNNNYLQWFSFKITKNISNYFVNVSEASLTSYLEKRFFDADKSIVLYNGVDTKRFKFNKVSRDYIRGKYLIKDDEILFGCIGRLAKEKDVKNLLCAVSLLEKKSSVSFKVLIVGDGPEKDSLIDYVLKHNLKNIVIFIDLQIDVIPYLSSIDILVLPSKTEGLPTILLEAMAMERIVISTDCGGVKEILCGLPSFITPVEDSVELSSSMNKALNLNHKTKNIYSKLYSEKIVSSFSLESTANEIYRFYNNILSEVKL